MIQGFDTEGPQLPIRSLLTARAMNAIRSDFLLVGGMAVVGPLFPADVHFLGEQSVLCQLQSCFG
jgi:hypothetical protein